jgi:hypothetical protein
MKAKQTDNQVKYNIERMKRVKAWEQRVQRDYMRMRKMNLDRGYILGELQRRHLREDGKPFSRVRIYQVLDIRKVNKALRQCRSATVSCVRGQGWR